MKLLHIEVTSRGEVWHGRYEMFRENSAELFHLTMSHDASIYRNFALAGYLEEQSIDSVMVAAKSWHDEIH